MPLTLGLVGLGLVSPFLLFGATGLGDETTAAGAEGGFVPDDTRRNRTGSGVVPGSDAIGLYLLGLGVCGLLAFGAVNVVG